MTISIIKFRSHCAEFDQTIKVSVAESKYSSLVFIETCVRIFDYAIFFLKNVHKGSLCFQIFKSYFQPSMFHFLLTF